MLPDPIFLNVHMFGIMIAVGVLFAFISLMYGLKKKNVEERFSDFLFYNTLVAVVIGFVFGYLFQSFYDYIENPEAGFQFGNGMTFIGGLIGGVISFLLGYFIFRKKYTDRLYQVISIFPCSILIAHAFGRVGCFFAGCCYGKETDSCFGLQFPELPNPVHPTQLYEAAFLFVMFGISAYLLLKKDFKHNMSLYLISYGVFRFLIEFIRDDDRGKLVGSLSPSQFWSIVMVILGVALVFIMNAVVKKAKADESAEIEQE